MRFILIMLVMQDQDLYSILIFVLLQNHILIRRCILCNNCELHSKSLMYVCVSRTLYHVYIYICYLTFRHPPTYYTLCIKKHIFKDSERFNANTKSSLKGALRFVSNVIFRITFINHLLTYLYNYCLMCQIFLSDVDQSSFVG